MGLLDPATSDGRVIFFLPWENMTIAGTTDTPTSVTAHPIPGEDDINFILREVRNYLSPDVEGRLPPPPSSVLCLLMVLWGVCSAARRRPGSLERDPPPGDRPKLQRHSVHLQEPRGQHQPERTGHHRWWAASFTQHTDRVCGCVFCQ